MKLRCCSCHHCKHGRGTPQGRGKRKRAVRHFRQTVRRCLRVGDYDHVPVAVSVDYTD